MTFNKILLRDFDEGDAQDVQSVARISWLYTYRNIYDKDYINSYIEKNYDLDSLRSFAQGVRSGDIFFKVSVVNGKIVGFSHLSASDSGFGLWRIYILPEHTGHSIGTSLITEAAKFVKEKGGREFYVWVHPENNEALNFYLRKGFVRVREKDTDEDLCLCKHIEV